MLTMNLSALLAAALALLSLSSSTASLAPPPPPPPLPLTVQTAGGAVKGKRSPFAPDINAYSGIFYGAPTGGAACFSSPKARAKWSGVHDATKTPPGCPQVRMLVLLVLVLLVLVLVLLVLVVWWC